MSVTIGWPGFTTSPILAVRVSTMPLIGALPLLKAKRCLAFRDLRSEARRALLVKGAFCHELVGRDDREHLVLLDLVALLNQQIGNLAADLRADDHVVRGDDAGEHQG